MESTRKITENVLWMCRLSLALCIVTLLWWVFVGGSRFFILSVISLAGWGIEWIILNKLLAGVLRDVHGHELYQVFIGKKKYTFSREPQGYVKMPNWMARSLVQRGAVVVKAVQFHERPAILQAAERGSQLAGALCINFALQAEYRANPSLLLEFDSYQKVYGQILEDLAPCMTEFQATLEEPAGLQLVLDFIAEWSPYHAIDCKIANG